MLTKTANGSLCRFFLLSFLALSLFISPVNQSHAVTTENFDGMVTSVVIDPEGWSMSVTIQGFKKNGTYILDPEGTPKVRLKVFSEGYDKNGNSTVVERSLIATKAVRKVYPDDGELNETETGTSLIVHLALNKPIYNDDKNGGTATSGQNPVVTFSRGWYQDREEIGSSLEAKETIIEAVNESTLDYPKVIGNWAWPGWDTVDQDFDLEAVFFHGHAIDQKPVALVEFDATDDSGNNSPQKLTNDLIISKKNDRNPVLVYSATMDVSSLASGELIKARFRAYPWVGDEDSILDSDSGTEKPSPLYGPYHLFNDKDGLYGSSVAYVDVNGSDTSGMVDDVAQSATVKNFPFQTIAAAVNAIKAFNELNFGRNDPSGSTVYLNAGTHNWIDGNVTESLTGSTYLTITKAPEVDKSEAIISSTGTRNILNAPFLKIEDVTISRSQISTTGNLLRGSADQVIWLDNCQIEGLGHINGPTVYLYGNAYFTNNIINEANNIFEFGATSAVSALIRNNEIRNSGRLHPYVLLGNNIFDTRVLLDSVNENIPLFDNSVIAFNKFLDLSNFAISFAASQNISHGFGLVQNLIERSGSGPSPVLQMSGDGSKTTTNHVIMWHNTIVGERSNLYYNDVGEEAYRQSNMSMVGNIMNEFNIKSDTFNHPVEHQNPARTGNWEPLYGAGYYGNLSHTGATSDAFQYEFFGLSSIWNQVGPNDDPKQDFVFIHDASFGTGDGTGNGDYGIKENSLADNLMNSQQVLPYDLKGVVRLNNCKGAAGAFEYNQETVMCINVVNVSPSAQGLRISWRFPSKDITSYKVFRSGLLLANTTQNTIVDDQVNVLQQDPILTYTIQAFNDNNEFVADITQQFSPLRNVTPSSNAGPDQVLVDSDLDGEEPVLLDGTGSSDSDGTIVSYEWSEAGVSLATGSQPSVTLAVGSHDITLQVTDNSGATASDTVTITVEAGAGGSENPTANAGPDQVLADSNFDGEEIVVLDGTGSSDSDGTIESYEWSEAGVPLATGSQPSVTLAVGNHVITLQVTDDSGAIATDEVTINIASDVSERVVVLPGLINDQEVYSDGNLKWIGQSSARVGGATGSQDSVWVMVFQLPELGALENIVSASLDLQLLKKVNNPQGQIDMYGLGFRNTPTVLAADFYQGPFGDDLTGVSALQDDFVTLSSLIGPITADETGKLNLAAYINAQYQAGASAGDYIFIRLNPDVADVSSFNYWEFSTANSVNGPFITLALSNSDNALPRASAGSDQTVIDTDQNGSESVVLFGSDSSDSDGNIVSYEWSEAGNVVATTSQPTVVLEVGVHQITLKVIDDSGATASDTVTITVEAGAGGSENPTANAGPDQVLADSNFDGEEIVVLDGTGSSDSDGTIESYEWSEAGVPLATGSQPSVTLAVGNHVITLQVTDDSGAIATDEVTINIASDVSERVVVLPGLINDQEVYSDGNLKWIGQSSARVGGATGSQDSVWVMVFQLPELGALENIVSASLDLQLLKKVNNPQGQIDMYGLGFRNTPTVLAADFYQGPFGDDLTGVSALQDDFVTLSSLIGPITADETGKLNLAAYINAQYQAGASAGDYIFIRLNPDVADVSSFNYWEFSTANSVNGPFITLALSNSDNALPRASAGSDQTVIDTDQNGSESVVLFGSDSSDSDGNIVSYEWSEAGNVVATTSQPTVVLEVGVHQITLKVIDDSGATASDTVTITVEAGAGGSENPTANAGPDQVLADSNFDGEEIVVLDGTGSSDSDGTIESYEWSEAGVPLATGSQPSVTLAVGNHVITLQVTDDSGAIATDEVTINIASDVSERVVVLPGLINDQEVYSDGNLKWIGQSSARVGGATGSQDSVWVMVFQLPELGALENIVSASLDLQLLKKVNNPQGQIDMYGLGFRNTPTVLAADFYQGPFGDDLTGVSALQDDFVTLSSLIGPITADETGKLNLAAYINAQYQAGASAGDYVFIRLNPDVAEVSNYHYWEFSTANSSNAPFLTLTLSESDIAL